MSITASLILLTAAAPQLADQAAPVARPAPLAVQARASVRILKPEMIRFERDAKADTRRQISRNSKEGSVWIEFR